jgi:hypothetical protein
MARRFNAFTSGHAAVYDRLGRRTFSGGLTPSRGAAADGRLFQAAAAGERDWSPVFGCSIVASESCESGQQGESIQ